MERGVTLSLDKGGLARVVSAPKEANTRYIRPILRRLLPFPFSSSSLSLSFFPLSSLLSLNPTRLLSPLDAFVYLLSLLSLPRGRVTRAGDVARSKVDDGEEYGWRIVRREESSKRSEDV